MRDSKTILVALEELKEALENDDWDLASSIDKEIKMQLETAIQQVTTDADKQDIIFILEKAQVLYQLLISRSESSKAKLESELKKISQDKKVSSFYLKSSGYR